MKRDETQAPADNSASPTQPDAVQSLLDQLRTAFLRLENAQAYVAADQAQRQAQRGLWARVVNFFTESPADGELLSAHALYQRTEEDVRSAMLAWLQRQAEVLLAQDADARDALEQQMQRQASLDRRVNTFSDLVASGRRAVNDLERAASACKSASSMEMLDFASKNKGISVMSTVRTNEASRAIRQASNSIQAFTALAPKRGTTAQLHDVDDTLDLIVDLVVDVPVDIFSWLNMRALDQAARKCREVHFALSKAVEDLEQAHKSAIQAQALGSQRILDLMRPFRLQAYADLPEQLRVLAPNP